ncbi:MAG: NAD-dependent epimerase/dehydratase family protein [Endomicrobia bacterium]|nr:NAD-dependent epimerase/dehydratase family protein [Endomicrobiia bacterium]
MEAKTNKCVIIGADSYLFSGLLPYLDGIELSYMTFQSWNESANLEILKEAGSVINFSIHPDFASRRIAEDKIIDVQIAEKLRDSKTNFIFFSSRKVYGTSAELVAYKETDALNPFDFYSENKAAAEKKLYDILGDRLSALRVSNVIGEPVLRSGYKTFMGWITESILKNGKLFVDQSKETKKDFITKDFLHKTLSFFIRNGISGTYNVSAGFPVTMDFLLTALAGKNNVVFEPGAPVKEQFVLDNAKLFSKTGIKITKDDVENGAEKFNMALMKMKKEAKC